jgi:hypothetical protein
MIEGGGGDTGFTVSAGELRSERYHRDNQVRETLRLSFTSLFEYRLKDMCVAPVNCWVSN